jgi:hypothetical protein
MEKYKIIKLPSPSFQGIPGMVARGMELIKPVFSQAF